MVLPVCDGCCCLLYYCSSSNIFLTFLLIFFFRLFNGHSACNFRTSSSSLVTTRLVLHLCCTILVRLLILIHISVSDRRRNSCPQCLTFSSNCLGSSIIAIMIIHSNCSILYTLAVHGYTYWLLGHYSFVCTYLNFRWHICANYQHVQ